MDSEDEIVVMAVEAAVERKRQETMQMKEVLEEGRVAVRDKAKECEMLKTEKLSTSSLLAMEAEKVKAIDDFMLFLEAIDHQNDDVENSQIFDEKAMMDIILTLLNGPGFAADDGKKNA